MVNIIEVKNKLKNGVTVPYVVWCDDENTYVVKFPGNPEGKKTLINEFIASNLCEYLNLPIMDYALINVKKEKKELIFVLDDTLNNEKTKSYKNMISEYCKII